jgi:hypothetical protein
MDMLKSILLASAFSLSAITLCQAATLPLDDLLATSNGGLTGLIQHAKSENSGSGNSGGGNDDSGNDGGGDDGTDDQGGDNDDDGADDDDDNDVSGSGRKKPRVPGGSGCDDPGDVEEHASCTAASP